MTRYVSNGDVNQFILCTTGATAASRDGRGRVRHHRRLRRAGTPRPLRLDRRRPAASSQLRQTQASASGTGPRTRLRRHGGGGGARGPSAAAAARRLAAV